MSTAIFQIQKEEKQIREFTLHDVTITQQGVQRAIFKITGLASDKYEVSYLDAQNDEIMAAVEEDYLIAEQTMEDDTITFQVNIKVQENQVKFMEEEEEEKDEVKSQQNSSENEDERGNPPHSLSQLNSSVEQIPQKVDEKDKVSQKIKALLEKSFEEEEKVANESCQNKEEIDSQKKQSQYQQKKQICNSVKEVVQEGKEVVQQVKEIVQQVKEDAKSEIEQKKQEIAWNRSLQQNEKMSVKSQTKQIQKQIIPTLNVEQQAQKKQQDFSGPNQVKKEIQQQNKKQKISSILEDQELLGALFSHFASKLPTILKPQCFKQYLRPAKSQISQICIKCHAQLTPCFYLNQNSQTICYDCQIECGQDELLVMIRSKKQYQELLAVKIIPVYKSELQSKGQIPAQKVQETINSIAQQKLSNQK